MMSDKEIVQTFEYLELGTKESREEYSFELLQSLNKNLPDEEVIVTESDSSHMQTEENA